VIAVGTYCGTGMEFTLGAGVSIFVGASDINYNGIYAQVKKEQRERILLPQ